MSKKIVCVLLFNFFSLYTAQENSKKVHPDTMKELGKFIQQKKQEKPSVYKRNTNPNVATHRSGPRVDGDPEQRNKNLQEKK